MAATTHRAKGPLAARGGYELPLTNLAAAAALAAVGPGRFRLGPPLPRRLAAAGAIGGALAAGGLVTKMLTTKANASGSADASARADASAKAAQGSRPSPEKPSSAR